MIRIGIVGCGNIAHTLAGVMKRLPEHMRIEAVAARDGHRARSFADEFGVAKAYGSYEAMCCARRPSASTPDRRRPSSPWPESGICSSPRPYGPATCHRAG